MTQVAACRGRAVTERGALKTALRRSFRYTAAVSMQSVLFGSGGHETQPPSGQLAGFQRCTGVLSQQMKCLGNSYWFHKAATFLRKRTQQCTIRCAPPRVHSTQHTSRSIHHAACVAPHRNMAAHGVGSHTRRTLHGSC